jgi:hypothetical protein
MDLALARQNGLVPGSRVVHQVSGWGVQVFNLDRRFERENWTWAMFTIRLPRLMKRYPRPLRWPRLKPSQQCHCRIGKLEVLDVNKGQVKCLRCGFYIGTESMPGRFAKGIKLLRRAHSRVGKTSQPTSKVGLARTESRKTIHIRQRKRKTRTNRSVVLRSKRAVRAKKGGRNG